MKLKQINDTSLKSIINNAMAVRGYKSYKDFACKCGLSPSTIANIVNLNDSSRIPNGNVLAIIQKHLGNDIVNRIINTVNNNCNEGYNPNRSAQKLPGSKRPTSKTTTGKIRLIKKKNKDPLNKTHNFTINKITSKLEK